MCVMSMIMDHYQERWTPMVPAPQPFINYPPTQIIIQPMVSAEEVAEFRKLLDRAREYDKRHDEPDCELAEKRQALKKLAKELGIDIAFIDKPETPNEATV